MTTQSIFWFVLVAVSGAFVVLIGLLMEQYSEQRFPKNIKDFRRCKIIKLCGEWFVIGGVCIEFSVGIFSAIDAWENEPQNLPIREMSVLASFRVKGGDFKEKDVKSFTHGASSWVAYLTLCETNEQPSNLMPGNLIAENFSCEYFSESLDSDRLYSLRFNLEPLGPLIPKQMSVKEIRKINRLIISAFFLPKNVEVVGGDATLMVNSEVLKGFIILPQNSQPANNKFFDPLTIFGTNAPPNAPSPLNMKLYFPTNM